MVCSVLIVDVLMRYVKRYVDVSVESRFIFRLREHSAMFKVVAVLDYKFLSYCFMCLRDSSIYIWTQFSSMKFAVASII